MPDFAAGRHRRLDGPRKWSKRTGDAMDLVFGRARRVFMLMEHPNQDALMA
jgi:hypothetical protein